MKDDSLQQEEVQVEESEWAPGVEVDASRMVENTVFLDDVAGISDVCLDDESEVAECRKLSDICGDSDVDLGCPNLSDGKDITLLKREINEDESLKHCRHLASNGSMGYSWKDGLLYHRQCDSVLGARERLVLPKSRRNLVVKLAHEYVGH